MEFNHLISGFLLIPLVGFLILLPIGKGQEKWITRVALWTAALQFFLLLFIVIYRVCIHAAPLNIRELVLYSGANYEFVIDFYFDHVSAVYLLVGASLTYLILRYSRYYMHMEKGHKRFFSTILFFYLAYNLTILAGNFETLFVGWEMLGVSSFLLVAFYRDRYLPVRNAVRVFSIYRIADVGIIIAMWASHHLWHENVTFSKLYDASLVHHLLTAHSSVGLVISLGLIVAAAAKSAQVPFTSWLPRAMEGPTPSSAIFYGALSVHFGVFLLLRTHPFWQQQYAARVLIALIGLVTTIAGYQMAKVQPTIKAQIAYASASQIGLMFIELALGLEIIALIHFCGNAFLRAYQLLISPSVVAYKIRDQYYHEPKFRMTMHRFIPERWHYTFFVFALKEWNLERFMGRYVFRVLKRIGNTFRFITLRSLLFLFVPSFAALAFLRFGSGITNAHLWPMIGTITGMLAFVLSLRAFAERKDPMMAWWLTVMNHFWILLAVSYNEEVSADHMLMYLSGVTAFGFVGWLVLLFLKRREQPYFGIHTYFGHVHRHGWAALVFLIAVLGLMGFPISPTFIGEDLVFSHIHDGQFVLAFANAGTFITGGITLIRLYSRLFLGISSYRDNATPIQST